MPTTEHRLRADACPGVFAPHEAADGALARVRLPGGVLGAATSRVIADVARHCGDGAVHLTSRGNLQLRGLDRADDRPAAWLSGAGLLPSVTHERVRNVLASPLSGIRGGRADVRGLAARLDEAVCARPRLRLLPGRFLFALDDGRGDVAAEDPDVSWRATGAATGTVLVAGTPVGSVPLDAAVDVLVRAAAAFLTLRAADAPASWRIAELPDAAARIAAVLALPAPRHATQDGPIRPEAPQPGDRHLGSPGRAERGSPVPTGDHGRGQAGPGPAPVGLIRRDDGATALAVAPVLGELSAAQLRLLATLSEHVLVTPWRTLLLPRAGTAERDAAAAAGLVVDAAAPATRVSACAGRPGCAKSLADVRADARVLLDAPGVGAVHVSGCARRCGRPHLPHADVVATADGYLVDDVPVPAGALRATLEGRP